jgi:hypothetical protein
MAIRSSCPLNFTNLFILLESSSIFQSLNPRPAVSVLHGNFT